MLVISAITILAAISGTFATGGVINAETRKVGNILTNTNNQLSNANVDYGGAGQAIVAEANRATVAASTQPEVDAINNAIRTLEDRRTRARAEINRDRTELVQWASNLPVVLKRRWATQISELQNQINNDRTQIDAAEERLDQAIQRLRTTNVVGATRAALNTDAQAVETAARQVVTQVSNSRTNLAFWQARLY